MSIWWGVDTLILKSYSLFIFKVDVYLLGLMSTVYILECYFECNIFCVIKPA